MTNQAQYNQLLTNCTIAADQLNDARMLGMSSTIIAALEQVSLLADEALDEFLGGENFSDDFLCYSLPGEAQDEQK